MPKTLRLAVTALLMALGQLQLHAAAGGGELEAASAVDAEIPPILFADWDYIGKDYPTWVSLDAAFTSSGELIEELFYPSLLSKVTALLETPTDDQKGCAPFGPVYLSWVNPPDRSSLAKAARHSDRILLGRVLAAEPGFDRGTAGQLFAIEPKKVLEGDPGPSRVFFFLPIGNFQIGERRYCKEDDRFPQPPEVGDEVLLLIPETPGPEEEFLDLQYETSLVVLPKSGGVRLPEIFTSHQGREEKEGPESRAGIFQIVARAL